ncbi:TetR/AcrR family transcriptional regulator [Nocardiopsis coralliicola]
MPEQKEPERRDAPAETEDGRGGRRSEQGWRERKKALTRSALVAAGLRLFAEQGYAETSIARIAAEAQIAPRTFFSYFAGKEELVFADTSDRMAAALRAVERRGPGDTPADALARIAPATFGGAGAEGVPDIELLGFTPLRMRLLAENPALRAAALDRVWATGQGLAEALARSFPELGEDAAAALVGSAAGAFMGAAAAVLRRGGPPEEVRRTAEAALAYAITAARTVPPPGPVHGVG